jgi:HSP20 family protein
MLPAGRWPMAARGSDADPFTAMRREMESLFDDLSGGLPTTSDTLTPMVNVAETSKGLEISAELPGVDQKDIELDISDGILTLKAERHAEKDERDEKKHYHIVERSHGTLLRRFALPFDVDADKVEANFGSGVLKVFVPRRQSAEKEKAKIAIKSKA